MKRVTVVVLVLVLALVFSGAAFGAIRRPRRSLMRPSSSQRGRLAWASDGVGARVS